MVPEESRKRLSDPEHDTEDKQFWVKKYYLKEVEFCERLAPNINIKAVINPNKRDNPTLPDLLVNGRLADLKYQSTPFYSAGVNYGYDPQYTVTFNQKDYFNYQDNYPDLDIFYWVDYPDMKKEYRGNIVKINRFEGVFFIKFQDLKGLIEEKHSPLHDYQRRTRDTVGNAKSSYLLDIRDFHCLVMLHGGDV